MSTANQDASAETFTDSQVEEAIKSFLKYGEETLNKSHGGYYAGHGWAARCLRYHLGKLQDKK